MFDFHIHSKVSFDGRADALDMALAAKAAGILELCFTDHLDYDPLDPDNKLAFETEVYNAAYDQLEVPGLTIRRGLEFGMLADNAAVLKQDLQRRHFDFVIGSVHFVEDLDIYFEPYWKGKTQEQAERIYMEQILTCVNAHEDFDVLGHLTYISKAWNNPTHRRIAYGDYRELTDEILRTLVKKGKGMEVNTSGMDACGAFLPDAAYLRRFKELGGTIVTVGSDAHDTNRAGQYCRQAVEMVGEIFGYVCTFENRTPVFHKL